MSEQPNTIKPAAEKKTGVSISGVVGAIPDNLPLKKGFDLLKDWVGGKPPTKKEVGEAAADTTGELADWFSGPFGGIVGPMVKDKMNKAFTDGLTVPNDAREKTGLGIAGAMIGGPIGLGMSIFGGATIDAIKENSKKTGGKTSNGTTSASESDSGFMKLIKSKVAPKASEAEKSKSTFEEALTINRDFTNTRIETPHALLSSMANTGQMGVQSSATGVAAPASENGSKSILDALSDPAYNPLNADFWNEAAWSFAIVILGIALIGFGAYSMMAGNSSTELTVKGA